MKNLLQKIGCMLLLTAVLTGCSSLRKTQEPMIPKDLVNYLAEFENAVMNQNAVKIMEMMDQEYVKNQHDDFLKGNTSQFLKEFFCGNVIEWGGFRCLDVYEIENIQRTELISQNGSYIVSYRVYTLKESIETSWTITVKEVDRKKSYGLYGASG